MAFFVERLAPTMAPLKASRLVGECDTVMREAELLSTLRAKIRRRDLCHVLDEPPKEGAALTWMEAGNMISLAIGSSIPDCHRLFMGNLPSVHRFPVVHRPIDSMICDRFIPS